MTVRSSNFCCLFTVRGAALFLFLLTANSRLAYSADEKIEAEGAAAEHGKSSDTTAATFHPAPVELKLDLRAGGEQLSSSSNVPSDSFSLLYGQWHGGLFFTRFVSLHGDGRIYRSIARESDDGKHEIHDYKQTENLLLQFGNPAYHPVHVIAGKGYIPFGIHHSVLMESFKLTLSERERPPRQYFGNLVLDDGKERKLEIGVGSDLAPGKSKDARRSETNLTSRSDTVFARFSQDFPELHATRALLSFRGNRGGQRVLGFGLINESPKGEVASFEYSRGRITPIPKEDSDEVMVRATYRGAYVQGTRVVGFIEDLSNLYRMGIIQGDWQLLQQLIFHFGFGYLKTETDNLNSRWFLSAGLEAGI